MNDAGIIKAYEGLTPNQQLNLFRNLYYNDGYATERGIIANAINDILPEYHRQKAEIERLTENIDLIYRQNVKIDGLKLCREAKVKAEAIKEFAERLKKKVQRYTVYDEGGWDADEYAVPVGAICDLVKEMTEGE